MADQRRPFSSAACIIQLGGSVGPGGVVVGAVDIGWATGFRCTETMQLFPIDILGNIDTQRYEPTARKFSGSFDSIHIMSAALSDLTTQGHGNFFRGNTVDVLNFRPTSLVLKDIVTNASVFMVTGWVPESRTWSISYGAVMTNQCSWVATHVEERSVVSL